MKTDWQTEHHRYRRFFVNVAQLYSQKKVRVYTELILSLLTISFFLFFAIKPTAVTISGLMKKIDDQKLITEKLQRKINALSAAQKEYLLLESDLYLIEQALPKEAHVSTLIKELEALARRSNVTIESIQFNKVTLQNETNTDQKPKEVDFNFVALGDYQNLKNFLQSLDSLRRIVSVKNFGFKIEEKGSERLSLNLTGNAFYLAESQQNE